MLILILLFLLPVDAFAQNVTYNFKLTWQNNEPKQTGSNIYRDGKVIAKVAQGVTTYSDPITGPAKTQYCWEVTAVTISVKVQNRTRLARRSPTRRLFRPRPSPLPRPETR